MSRPGNTDSGQDSVAPRSLAALLVFIAITAFLGLTGFAVKSDVTVLRQICGALFLGFLPGYLTLRVLRTSAISLAETIALSLGLSISLDMLVGLIINFAYPALGYVTPLSVPSILYSFLAVTFLLTIFACWRNRRGFPISLDLLKIDPRLGPYLVVPAALPVIAVVGMFRMNTDGNSQLVIVLLLLIIAYTVFLTANRSNLPASIYAPTIYLIGVSVVLLLALRSSYLVGFDIHTEYYIFSHTVSNQRWMVFTNTAYDSALSVSILPTAFQSIVNIDSQYTFKILFPLIFSFAPLVVFFIARKYVRDSFAFLASIYFVSQYYFVYAESSPRTVVAIFFFALSVMILLRDNLRPFERNLLFVVFSLSVVFSHYSTAYIYIVLLALTWMLRQILGRRSRGDQRVRFEVIAFVSTVAFLWYTAVSQVAFNDAVLFFKTTLGSLSSFADVSSRGPGAVVLGSGLRSGDFLQQGNFIVSWLTILLVALGLVGTAIRRRGFLFKRQTGPLGFSEGDIDLDFFLLSAVGFFMMVASVLLPFILKGYDLYRVYIQVSTMLSVFFVIGGGVIASPLRQRPRLHVAHFLVLLVLIPYFLFNSGGMYQFFGNDHAMFLNSSGQDYEVLYVHDQESIAARWLKNNMINTIPVYTDFSGEGRLISQGGILESFYDSQTIDNGQPLPYCYFFLRYTGVVNSKLLDNQNQWHDLSAYEGQFESVNLIYSNGGSEVYR